MLLEGEQCGGATVEEQGGLGSLDEIRSHTASTRAERIAGTEEPHLDAHERAFNRCYSLSGVFANEAFAPLWFSVDHQDVSPRLSVPPQITQSRATRDLQGERWMFRLTVLDDVVVPPSRGPLNRNGR